jgi:hypothetical protein
MKLTNPKNGETIESAFPTHAQAAAALALRVQAGEFFKPEFPYSMIDAARHSRGPSEGQAFWLHKLANEGVKQKEVVATKTIDLSGLRAIFANAAAKLKRPAIVLNVDGSEVKLAVAGPRSRHAGNIMVASAAYGGAYYGRVDAEGSFFPGRDTSAAVEAMLAKMSTDPAGTAAAHGHATGCCCFCNRELKDERSTSVGYGPVCADHFGLPWGAKPIRKRAARVIA